MQWYGYRSQNLMVDPDTGSHELRERCHSGKEPVGKGPGFPYGAIQPKAGAGLKEPDQVCNGLIWFIKTKPGVGA